MFGERGVAKCVPNPREQRVIELVAQGLTNSEVARAIGTTEYVIKNNLRTIYDKLGLWNRVELALWYEARRQESRPSNKIANRTLDPDIPAILTSDLS
jgi:DNA-binding CsgD family transcriptional regulator